MVLLTKEETGAEKLWLAIASEDRNGLGKLLHSLGHKAGTLCCLQIFKVVFNKRSRQRDSMSPIHLASKHGDAECLHLMLSIAEPDTNTVTEMLGWSPLHYCMFGGHVHAARLLLKHGAQIDIRDVDEQTPLHLALSRGHRRAAAYLLQRGADVHLQDKHGRGVLHICLDETLQQHANWPLKIILDMIDFLVLKGCNVDDFDHNGDTALHYCSRRRKPDAAQIATALLGYSLNSVNISNARGHTPLHDATSKELIDLLVDNGANINALTPEGRTALHLTVEDGQLVKTLLGRGADADIADAQGRNPFLRACSFPNISEETLKLLHESTTNPTSTDNLGNDALLIAANAGVKTEAMQFLLQMSDINGVNKKNQCALYLALKEKHYDVATLLVKTGADYEIPDNQGITPRQIDPKFFKRRNLNVAISRNSTPILGASAHELERSEISVKSQVQPSPDSGLEVKTPEVDLTGNEYDDDIEQEINKMLVEQEAEMKNQDQEGENIDLKENDSEIDDKHETNEIGETEISEDEEDEGEEEEVGLVDETIETVQKESSGTKAKAKVKKKKVLKKKMTKNSAKSTKSSTKKPLKTQKPKDKTVQSELGIVKEEMEDMKEMLEELEKEGQLIEDELKQKLESKLTNQLSRMKTEIDEITEELNLISSRNTGPPRGLHKLGGISKPPHLANKK